MPSRRQVTLGIAATAAQVAASRLTRASEAPRTAEGYTGIWYQNQPSGDRYGYKYSGGFATYPQQQSPIAIHVPSQKKTFFCYGGTVEGKEELLHMDAAPEQAHGGRAR